MKNHTHIYKIILLISYFLFAISYIGTAQPNRDKYRDQKWIFGFESNNHVQYPEAGNSILNFSTEPPNAYFQYTDMNFQSVSSSLCDTAGNLIAYTNGIYIADKTHQKMVNGDSIGFGDLWLQNQNLGSPYIQAGAMLLPISCNNNCGAMVYPYTELSTDGIFVGKGLDIAYINFNNNNKGVVVQKNIPIISDSIRGGLITACRHANGRDWWLLMPNKYLYKYQIFLLSPEGVLSIAPQIMSQQVPNFAIIAKFTPNGRIYAHHDPIVGTYLYDFDRCTGELSNRQLIPLAREFRTYFCGIEFSPNSRYMYVTSDTSIVQYDMQVANISASGIIVANYDGFALNNVWATNFFLLQLAPNGKIYGNSMNGKYLHVIHNPNERGLACNVEQRGFELPTWYRGGTMPSFPYFRLGSEPGTVCDSLGIETGVDTLATNPLNPPKGDFQLSVSPNPTSDACTVSLTSSSLLSSPFGGQRGFVRLLSADGRLLDTYTNPFLNQNNFTINLKNYAKGVYIIEYEGSDGSRARARIIRQ